MHSVPELSSKNASLYAIMLLCLLMIIKIGVLLDGRENAHFIQRVCFLLRW